MVQHGTYSERACGARFLVFVCSVLCFRLASATFDINRRQLQMVADHLTMEECRKLSESLHEEGFEPQSVPIGRNEPKGVSCLRLLEHWNTHEGKGKSYHLLDLRLRQLGHYDIADKLSKSVADEKVGEVRDAFLKDPFRAKIHKNSPLLAESVSESKLAPEARNSSSWSWNEIMECVLLVVLGISGLFLMLLTLVRCFLPDSFARMRATLYESFTGGRPEEEEEFFVM